MVGALREAVLRQRKDLEFKIHGMNLIVLHKLMRSTGYLRILDWDFMVLVLIPMANGEVTFAQGIWIGNS